MTRKKILIILLLAITAIGFSYAAVPFFSSMQPTQEKINNHILNIAVNDIEPGSYKITGWGLNAIGIYRPGKKSISKLISYNTEVWGPKISHETIKDLYVYEIKSTYKGCWLKDLTEYLPEHENHEGWYDICHMGAWDFTGRAFKNVNVPKNTHLDNLNNIAFRFIENNTIQIRK